MFKKKVFIVFEGIEGSGKTAHSASLSKKFKDFKIPHLYLREPGGSINSERIRNFVLKKKNKQFHPITDTLLYLAARNEHVQKLIKPSLKKKKIIICDRFIDSTIAYQVSGKSVNKNLVTHIHNNILAGVKPNITFLLTVKIESAMKRINKRKHKNRYDKFNKEFYKKVQKTFIRNAKLNKKRYFIIDNSENSNKVENIIFNIIKKKLSL